MVDRLGFTNVTAMLGICTFFYLFLKRKRVLSKRRRHADPELVLERKPESVTFLDQSSYEVLTAIVDAFIPAYTLDYGGTAVEQLKHGIESLSPSLLEECEKPNSDCTLRLENIMRIEGTRNSNDKRLCAIVAHLREGAVQRKTHIAMANAMESLLSPDEKFKLFGLLKFMGTSAGMLTLTGIPVALQQMPLADRVDTLTMLRDSKLAALRGAYQTFKRLTVNLFLSYAEHGERNPSWDAIGYFPKVNEEKINQLKNNCDELRSKIEYETDELATSQSQQLVDTIHADVVVVGSGAGGGTVASELAKAGYSVLVLEKGGYFRREDFKEWEEPEAMLHLYEKGGLCASEDGNVVVLAGACVGGGTTVNWSASFRTPDYVRKDWVDEGLTAFRPNGEFDESLDVVHKLVNVNSENSYTDRECDGTDASFKININNRLLWESAKKTGYEPEKIPRNVKNCVDCGHCCFGCPYEAKQSTITGLMEPMVSKCVEKINNDGSNTIVKGLKIIADCHVGKVTYTHCNGKKFANGVEATVTIYPARGSPREGLNRATPTGKRNLKVNAKVVIASAGALHTPALLLRSGLNHPLIGRHLALHPVIGLAGLFGSDTLNKYYSEGEKGNNSTVAQLSRDQQCNNLTTTGLSFGVSMGVVVRSPPIGPDKSDKYPRYRVAVQTPPIHPGIFGLILPWLGSGLSAKLSMLVYNNIAAMIGISRDKSQEQNRIGIDAEGNPVVYYTITEHDKPMLLAGLEAQMRLMYAAGATHIFPVHEKMDWHYCHGEEPLETYIQRVKDQGIEANRMQIFSAHQMGSCRMAVNSKDGPTKPTGELHDVDNLYVADASVFPTSLGINPMITIEAIAHMTAKNIVKRLEGLI